MRPYPFIVTIIILLALSSDAFCLAPPEEPSYERLCQEGREKLLALDYEGAEQAYKKAIHAAPDKSLGYFGRALALCELGDHDKAIELANQAIERSDNDAPSLVVRGTAHHRKGDLESAKNDLDEAINLSENEGGAYAERGWVYLALGDRRQAMSDLDEALKRNPRDHDTYVVRARLRFREGRLRDAEKDYEVAVSLHPDSAEDSFCLGQVRFCNKKFDRASEAASKALEKNEKYGEARVLKGACLFHLGEFDQALKELNQAAHDNPADAGCFRWLGETYLKLGKVEEAIASLEKATEMPGAYPGAHRTLAAAYTKAELPEKAEAAKTTAQELTTRLRETIPPELVQWEDSFTSRTAGIDTFKPALAVSEMLKDHTESLTAQERTFAESQRRELEPWQSDLEICQTSLVVPDETNDANDLFEQSVKLFDAGKYQEAAFSFEKTRDRYQAALDAYEKVVSKDHRLWLDWGEKRLDRLVDPPPSLSVLSTGADCQYRLENQTGFTRHTDRLAARIKTQGMLNPANGVYSMLLLAEFRDRHGDREGAWNAVQEAAEFCEGISQAWPRALERARCAGAAARYGHKEGWSSYFNKAMEDVNKSDRHERPREQRRTYIRCVAYASATASKQAYDHARKYEQYRDTTSIMRARAYARTALAAALRTKKLPDQERIFEESYALALGYMLVVTSNGDENFLRVELIKADLAAGAVDRAWMGSTSLPAPFYRALFMGRVIQLAHENDQLALAREMVKHLPNSPGAAEGVCALAEAEVRLGDRSFVELRRWIDGLPSEEQQAAAMLGIALGVKRGRLASQVMETSHNESSSTSETRSANEATPPTERDTPPLSTKTLPEQLAENPDNEQLQEAFNNSDASAPEWCLEEAAKQISEVEHPCVRARLWLQTAHARAAMKDSDGYRDAVDQITACTIAMWSRILQRRDPPRIGYDDRFCWEFNAKHRRAEFEDITNLLRILLDLEILQDERGEKDEAFRTLMLALRCTERMPKNTSFVKQVSPHCAAAWLMRIAGRAALRGHSELKDILTADGPWFPDRHNYISRKYFLSLAAAQTGDLATLKEFEALTSKSAERGNDSPPKTHAARVNALIALVAARSGDQALYRKASMKVGGYVSRPRGAASRSVFLELAEATVAAGKPEVALEYVKQADLRGLEGDFALAAIVEKMIEQEKAASARKVAEGIQHVIAGSRAWYAVAKAETAAGHQKPSELFVGAIRRRYPPQRAAILAGIAAGLKER